MGFATEEERKAESEKRRFRNANTIKIQVMENGLLITEGDNPTGKIFPNIDEARTAIMRFHIRRKEEILKKKKEELGNNSLRIRLAERREGKPKEIRRKGMTVKE